MVYSRDESIGEEMGVVIGRVNENTVVVILKDLIHLPHQWYVKKEK